MEFLTVEKGMFLPSAQKGELEVHCDDDRVKSPWIDQESARVSSVIF